MPRLSVIVPIFNGTEVLPAFFESLSGALPEGSELILVDDGSTEPVWDAVPELPRAERVRRLRNDTNLGYSVAVNKAFAEVDGEVIVQLNTDLVLDRSCIGGMIGLIERERDVGIVGSKLVFPTTGRIQHAGMAFGNHTKSHIYFELPAEHALCAQTREVQVMAGATVAMTRRVLDRIGPLDEGYFNHNEDVEHCLLAAKHGLRNFVCAESIAHHWESRSGPARFARLEASDGIFWSRWGQAIEADLDRFVDEALDHVVGEHPELESLRLEVIDLSRGVDQEIVLGCLERRWPGIRERVRRHRQLNNPTGRLFLPLLLPRHTVAEPVPFVYLVDGFRELEENSLWYERRRALVGEELVVDLSGAAVSTAELAGR